MYEKMKEKNEVYESFNIDASLFKRWNSTIPIGFYKEYSK